MGISSAVQTRLHGFRTIFPFLVAALLVFHADTLAQSRRPLRQYVHDHWGVPQGLPQNSAYTLFQSSDGYLWFGTQEGLVRFDGLQFKVIDRTNNKDMRNNWGFPFAEDQRGGIWMMYAGRNLGVGRYANGVFHTVDTTDGLPSNDIRYVRTTRDGSVWIFERSARLVTQYLHGTMKTWRQSDGLPTDSVFSVSEDSKGNFWFNTPHGVAKYDGHTFALVTNVAAFGMGHRGIEAIFEDSQGTVWIRTGSGLVRLKDGKTRIFTTKDGLLKDNANPILEDKDGAIWFFSTEGINKMAGGKILSYKTKTPFTNVNDVCVGEDNALWIGTNEGIWRFADGKYDHYGKENGLANDNIGTMLIDREGSVWFGIDGNGLHRLREGKFVTYSREDGLKSNDITSVLEDSRNNLWLGTRGGGLARLTGTTVRVFDEKDKLFPWIGSIAEDHQGTMWVTAFEGNRTKIYRINNDVVKEYKQHGISFDQAYGIIVRKSGAVLVALADSILSFQHGKFTLLNKELVKARPSCLIEDSKQQLWIGTFGGGLYLLKDQTLVHFSEEQGFRAARANSVYEDHDGEIWIATDSDGLYRYKDGTFFNFNPENGLPEYTLGSIVEDNVGYLWFGTNRAAYRISKKALDDFAEGKGSSYSYSAYGTSDGMKSGETNALGWPNIWKMKDGRIVFTTVAGAAVVNPADIKLNEIPPPVVIDRFLVEGARQPTDTLIRVPAGKERFEFHYAGLSFIGADKVRYKYKLEGQDKDWIDAGGRRDAYYTSLRPGTYRFRVIAANSDGVWNETGASLQFEMMPFFYQSTWFLSLVVLGFLAGGPSFYYLRMKNVKKQAAELESLVQKRTSELQNTLDHLKETQNQLVLSEKMASLGQLTAGIAHEIKNPLNFITNFAVLSQDLTKDLRTELAAEKKKVDPKRAEEIEEILGDLEQNVTKINEHGKRADSIVRGMLLHSRGKAGERQETDINALLSEYTNLAYHGMRALDQSFNVKIETDLDPSIGKMKVVPQDLSRAFLNIVNNACYAANDKRKNAQNGFSPVVKVSAKNLGDTIEIRIRDNGNGIPHEVLDRMFNPFFTTKPAGIGTGLGLSLTYDIITQVHKGQIDVDTKEGEFAEFIIRIPKESDGGQA